MSIKADLRNYQRKGVNSILKKYNGKALLADDMGLGKTLQSIVVLNRLSKEIALIVCPAPLKYNWVDEFQKFLPNEKPYVCQGQKTPEKIPKGARVFICNYEILQHWRDWFLKKNVNIMILDESHYVKNHSSKRYKAAFAISKSCRYKILLTGTPIENRPAELWSQLQIIDRKMFPSWLLFVKRYNGARRNQYGWELKSATNVKELHRLLKEKCMIRRRKEDVLKELPEKVRTVIPIDIKNRKEYTFAEQNIIRWMKKNTDLDVAKSKKAQAIVKLDKLKYISGLGKIDEVCKWINETSQNKKLVVFCYHKDVLAALAKKINNYVLLSAEVKTGMPRQELVHKFQEDESVRVFLTTIKVGGTGLTLTASATTVFVQQDWNPSMHNQAEDRVHRIGQEADSVTAIYFVAKDTVEEKIINLIDAKRQDVTSIIDGQEVKESELLTELMESMLK
jgi:SWI/SNF-related matrix-associated actin-dependent regulator 1 of chromatin subfamily A